MSVRDIPGPGLAGPATGEDAPRVLSLDALRTRVQNRENPDRSLLKAFHHEGLGADLLIGPMSSAGYVAVENPETLGPVGSPMEGKKISDKSTDELNRVLAYLMHGVFLDTGDRLIHMSRDDALALHRAEGCGPSNIALINAIKELNPPRDYLRSEVHRALVLGKSTSLFVLLALKVGMGQQLIDYMAPSATPEQKAWAAAQLKKLEEVQLELEPYAEFEKTAQALGIDLQMPPSPPPQVETHIPN